MVLTGRLFSVVMRCFASVAVADVDGVVGVGGYVVVGGIVVLLRCCVRRHCTRV